MKVSMSEPVLRKLLKDTPEHGRREVSDSKRVGLRLRIYADGRAVWMYEKRVKHGAKRKHTFGTYPEPIGLADARKMALEIEAEAARGYDRVMVQKEERLKAEQAKARTKTLQNVIDIYTELHLANLRTGQKRQRELEVALETHIRLPIGDLTRGDLQHEIDSKAKEGKTVAANRLRAAFKAFATWAHGRNYIETDIGQGLTKAGKEAARERVLSVEEVRAIWSATFELGDIWGPVFRLLILTVQRRGEILGLRIGEIELSRSRFLKLGAQTKNEKGHVTHLSRPALEEVTQAMQRAKNRAANKDYPPDILFTTTGKTAVSGVSRAKERLDKLLGDDVSPWRLHDLRTAFSTAMADAGVPEAVADRVLNHVAQGSAPSAVSRVYNQADMLPQRAAALDRWAAMVTGEVGKVMRISRDA